MKTFPSAIFKKGISYFLTTLIILQSVGCTYFKVRKTEGDFENTLKDIGELNKYFLIHDHDNTWVLSNISVDSINLYGALELVDEENIYYADKRGYRYHKDEKEILNEVHFYFNEEAPKLNSATTIIPLSAIKEIRIIEKNTGKTVASYVFTTLGTLMGVFVIVMTIIILTKSSCPYIYVDDGEGFVFQGETFGGAIAQNLERDDYLPLPSIQMKEGIYRLRVNNELKERQYTDVAELIIVNHSEEQEVLLDKYGQAQLIEELHTSRQATSLDGTNIQSVLEKKDNEVFLFNHQMVSKNGAILKFNKPSKAALGKLVFKAKNTLWFDYMFGEFLEKFGMSFDKWMNKQAQLLPSERLEKILENDFPLSVYVKRDNEWQLVDYLYTVGPLANRDFVIPIDLSGISGNEVEIKMETGFMFWELDFAAMDFSDHTKLDVTRLKPFSAWGTGAQDWTAALGKIDGNYMAQEKVGDVTEIIYQVPPALQQQSQTVFLHTRGYYELIRDFDGLPQISALNKFKVPGYFSEFSRAGYLRTLQVGEGYFASIKSN
jgi:hypothetical protein